MKALRRLGNPWLGLGFNLGYAVFSCSLGLITLSRWFTVIGAYYAVLACARFCVLMARRSSGSGDNLEPFTRRFTGILLAALACCLAAVNYLTILEGRGTAFHEIIMIAIAAYTFTKITLAIAGLIRSRKSACFYSRTLCSIALADAIASIYSLQRSMLVSFPGMQAADIRLMNILTGTAASLAVLLLGINLIGGRITTMAKSKLIQANEKIAETVTEGYKKIEQGVTEGYKKIETGVVEGFTKIEDKFVNAYLTREGETVEQAKARLRKETSEKQ